MAATLASQTGQVPAVNIKSMCACNAFNIAPSTGTSRLGL
jgi:hypothetical protein